MNTKKLHRRYMEFKGMRSVKDLAYVIDMPAHAITLQAAMPHYEEFHIRKRSGEYRLVEDPDPVLKKIQRRVNRFLQAVYFIHKTKAAYGFIIAVKKKKLRNIVTNAKRHLNAGYLLNIDIEDYFHSIATTQVYRIFSSPPLLFRSQLATLLSKLCTYKNRLPMGAPTSPVLSNFYAMELDRELDRYADEQDFVFTRYVDDMTFSGDSPIKPHHLDDVRNILRKYALALNNDKTRFFGPGEPKTVTGILVSDKLAVSPDLLGETRGEIRKLRTIIEVSRRHTRKEIDWIRLYKQRISGYLQFSKQVLGPNDPLLQNMQQEYHDALHPPDPADPVSWSMLPYRF